MSSTNIQIAIKMRPFIEREKREKLEPQWLIKENNIVQIDSTQNFIGEPYGFDHIFDNTKSNKDVYDALVKPLVLSCLEGINSTIFVYGQTSSGKTHTMLGDKNIPGIISFTIDDIFTYIEENTANKHFLLRCSYLEIYNEKINDLLDTNAKDIKIREDYNKGVYVAVKEEVIREPEELFNLMKKGMKTRKIGCTDMNERSSRSHTIFKLVIESQSKESQGSITESTLSLVDLAGSERVGQMNMGRERQVEGVSINKSLTTLGLVIRKLSENEAYINYRDSKLTRLLQHSLGGNSRTLIIATITVAASEETKSTLDFAQRAKHVKNRPIINERVTDKDQLKQYEHLCEDYKDQIEKLRQERIEKDKTINTLEDKITNIKLFTAGNFENSLKPARIPLRRHTLGHYKPHKKKFSIMDPGGLEENSDSEDLAKIISPVKSELCSHVANIDDKENSFLNDSVSSSPYKLVVPKKANTPKSPSSNSRLEKELLEESYVNLKYFTSLEKQFQGKTDELEELRELIERLRDENFQLQEENLNRGDTCIKMMENNKCIYEQLVVLRNILEIKPGEEIRRNSLHTIVEEDMELFNDDLDSSMSSTEVTMNENTIMEENQHLKKQLDDRDRIIEELKNDMNAKILSKEADCVKLEEENEQLKSKIQSKDEAIDKLKANIINDRDVKEAELEILNNKIKKLNDYKEEMHTKLSELQKLQEMVVDGEDISSLKSRNKALKEDLDDLRRERDDLKQLTAYDALKIKELEEEIESLRKLKSEKDKLILEKDLELNILKNTNEDVNASKNNEEYCLNEQNKQLKSELEDTIFLLSGEQKELEKLSHELEKKTEDVKALEKIITNLKNSQKDQTEKVQELTDINSNLREQIKILGEVMGENSKLKDELEINLTMKQKVEEKDEELAFLKEMCETLRQESRNSREQLELMSLELEEKTELYNAMLINYSEKSIVIESLEKEIQEMNEQLNEFSAIPAIGDLKVQLEQKVEEIKCLEEDKKELMRNLDNNLSLKATIDGYIKDIQVLETTSDKQKSEIDELKNQLHKKINELDERTDCYQDAVSKYNVKMVEYECLINVNSKLKNELNMLSEMQQKEIVEGEFVINRLKKENDDLLDRLNNVNEGGLFKEENERLKCELQDALFQLSGEQKELENVCQSLNEKTGNIHALEQVISSLKNNRDQQVEKINDLTNNNLRLQEEIYRNEEQIKMLHEVMEENESLNKVKQSETKGQLQCITSELQEKTELYNSILSDNSKKNTVIDSLEKEIEELKIKLPEIDHLQFQLKQHLQEIDNLKEENKIMMQSLDSNKCLQQTMQMYVKDIQNLQATSEEQAAEIEALKTQLHLKIIELNGKSDILSNYNAIKLQNDQYLKEIENLAEIRSRLTQSLNDNAALEQAIHGYLKDIQILQVTSENQKTEIDDLRKQLHSKIAALDGNTNSYRDLLTNYESKMEEYEQQTEEMNVLRDQLHSKIIELNEKTESHNNALANYNAKKLENEQLKEITKLKEDQITELRIELNEKTESYNAMVSTHIINVKGIENLEKDKKNLEQAVHKYLGEIQILQDTSDDQKREIHELTNKLDSKLSELSEMTKYYNEVLSKYNGKMVEYECLQNENVQLKSLAGVQQNNQSQTRTVCGLQLETQETDELNCKLSSLSEELRLKSQEIDRLSDDRTRLMVSRQEIESVLLDTKRQLKERCEDYFQLKGKYNALEIQQFKCKKDLTVAKQELEMEKKNLNKLKIVLQNSDVKSKPLPPSEQVTELMVKIKGLNQELEEARQELTSKTLQIVAANEEIEKIKSNVIDNEKDRFDYEKCKLQFEELQRTHVDVEQRYGILESKFNAEKSKVESFSHKLQISEREVASLQSKISDLIQYKKRVQEKENQSDKNTVSGLSEEGRPLSPSHLRKIKRQSIHDQRRGLAPDDGNLFEEMDLGCTDCMEMKSELTKIQDENKVLLSEIDALKAENKFFDKENEDMLIIIKELEKKENDLYYQLDKCKSSTDVSPTDLELNKMRAELKEMITKNTELQNELEQNMKMIRKYKDRIAQLESTHLKVEVGKPHGDNLCRKEDKATQATCDLHQKYCNLKKIVLLRRREGNYLRSKLNLPPDCPVLPDDVQRLQKPSPSS